MVRGDIFHFTIVTFRHANVGGVTSRQFTLFNQCSLRLYSRAYFRERYTEDGVFLCNKLELIFNIQPYIYI